MDKQMQITTTIQSDKAEKYLVVLCRHFSRKVEAQWDESYGTVRFPLGEAVFRVNDERDKLLITCTADTQLNLNRVRGVIDGHVHLFSRRDPIKLTWS